MNGSRTIVTMCGLGLVGVLVLAGAGSALAQGKTTMDIYGAAMLDMGYQSGQSDPDWFDVMRPTKLPSYENQYGMDGTFFSGVRQSRLGFKTSTPTEMGDLKTIFEFELFGTGVDAGQTTFRLRHAYGELGKFGAGQTWSPFMDINVFPNSLEYWGPNAMVFFRNVQVRWMPIQGDTFMTLALERPGASGDRGVYDDRVELQDAKARFEVPDLSAEYHLATGFGYVELAGIARSITWDDLGAQPGDVSGDVLGWGLNLSSNVKLGDANTVRLQFVYGEGCQNYLNDAPVDVGIQNNEDATVEGVALPLTGAVAFLDHNWSPRYSTAIGYSYLSIDNSNGQTDDAFHIGHYGLVNLLYTPVPNFMVGIEGQYGKRENFNDGFTSDDFRVQFSAKYNFSSRIGG